jgi:hypothetical protein
MKYEFSIPPVAIRVDYAFWEKIKAFFKRLIPDNNGHTWKQINPIWHPTTVYYCTRCQAGSSYPSIFLIGNGFEPIGCDEFNATNAARQIHDW